MAKPAGPALLDPATIPQFVNALPNALSDAFIYQPSGLNGAMPHYDVGAYLKTGIDLGLGPDPVTGEARLTDVFAYGASAQSATYPGMSFVVQRNQPIEVTWSNHLPSQHLLDVDPTLLDPAEGYDPATSSFASGVPMVVHLHGGHTDSASDGLPDQWYTRDGDDADDMPDRMGMDFHHLNMMAGTGTTFTYRNDQDAATLWYHDHAMGITRLNAYAGLAGFYIVRDEWDTGAADNPLDLPAGKYEIPFVIQDKQFLADGQLYFASAPVLDAAGNLVTPTGTLPETFGDVILVNGQAWPYQEVEARRYRFHILNGSDSRFYNLSFPTSSGVKMWIVGDDQGLLNSPVPVSRLTVLPGERYDVVVDFTGLAGKNIILENDAKTPYPRGSMVKNGTTDRIMQFRVVPATSTDDSFVPTAAYSLRRGSEPGDVDLPITAPTTAGVPVRKLGLFEMMDQYGRMEPMLGTTDGFMHYMEPITENPALGATEVWEIYNNTPDAHPIHLHLVKFQLVNRQGFKANVDPMTGKMSRIVLDKKVIVPTAAEMAWQDTIIMYPGQVTRIIATFDLPGKYVWHCHILSHEEHDMMRPFYVGPIPDGDMGSMLKSTTNVLGADQGGMLR